MRRKQPKKYGELCAWCEGEAGRCNNGRETRVSKRPAAAISNGAHSSELSLPAVAAPVLPVLETHANQASGSGSANQLAVLQSIAASLSTLVSMHTQVQFQSTEWKASLVQELAVAWRVRMCVMLYDSVEIHRALMSRVNRITGKSAPLDVEMIVDRDHHNRGTCDWQADRLKELARRIPLGRIRLGTGLAGNGIMHAKLIVVDDRIAYVGSNNVTNAAINYNREGVVRLVGGPPIQDILNYITAIAANSSFLDGSCVP